MDRGLFLIVFACSGAAALVYEVVWTRLMALELGHGLAAASTVLAAFMGGLAAGAAAGGRIGRRLTAVQALATYARLELAIALAALALPWVLGLLTPLLSTFYADGAGGRLFGAVRLLSSLALLSLPAAAMGATFPVASRWMVRGASALAADAGTLYAVNTVGAAAGALAAGFVLLPAFGLTGATWVGVGLNLAAAGGAWWLAARNRSVPDLGAERAPAADQPPRRKRMPAAAGTATSGAGPGRLWLGAAALGITGFTSLALQVVWTRLLASVLGPTTYAFSLVVAVFILGIAGGSAVAARWPRRRPRPVTALALVMTAASLLALAAASLVDRAVLHIGQEVAAPDASFGAILLTGGLLAAALLLPMALAFGAAFPLALAVASRSDGTVAEDVGFVYAVNTVGAVAGALAAGFGLIPWLGLHGTIRLVGVIAAAGAMGIGLAAGPGRHRWLVAAAAAAGAITAWQAPGWDRALLSSGAYKYAATLRGPDLETALTAGTLLYYREGAAATVAVRRLAGATSLSIDGKVDASDAGDMLTQRLLAHLPLLLHPSPRRAAILGLGSGVTLASALTHDLEQVVVLEISPEVAEAAAQTFSHVNRGALTDNRTRLVLGDGRTHLRLSPVQHDVIVSEPSNPWMAGIAALFTREFFATARSRLTPDGVFCQWAHTYDISDADLRSIVATFLSVFPDGTLWMVGDADILLVGSATPLADRLARLPDRWAERRRAAADLASVGATAPFAVLSLFVAEGEALRQWAGRAAIQTDGHARLEFSGPRSVFGAAAGNGAQALRDLAAASPRPPAVAGAVAAADAAAWRDVGQMLYRADSFAAALQYFLRAVESNPRDAAALDGLVRAAVPTGQADQVGELLARLARQVDHEEAQLALSRLLAAQGRWNESAAAAFALLQRRPGSLPALEQLASVLSDAGDAERLAPVVARLRLDAPEAASTHYYAAALAYLENRPEAAIRNAEAALTREASHARAHNLLGAVLAGAGQRDRARAAFLAALDSDPRDPATYSNLAALELEAGAVDRARHYFAEALTLDPDNSIARQGLADALARR